MTATAAPSTRLNGPILILARLAWVVILIYSIGKLTIGTPLLHSEYQVVCTGTLATCSTQVGPTTEDARDLAAAGLSLEKFALLASGFQLLQVTVWMGVGLIIFALRSDDWMALLVSATMIMFNTGSVGDPIARAYPSLAWLAGAGFSLQNTLLFLMIGLFPNGRFAPRWMRWYWLVMISLPFIEFFFLPENIDYLWAPVWVSFLVLSPYSQIYRYLKSSTPAERMQTKWVVYGLALFAAMLLLGALLQEINLLPNIFVSAFWFGFTALCIPLGFGISVLRYRLWDVDILIRRTLIYSALTLTLSLIFFGSIALIQRLFTTASGQESTIATVISTLLIAAIVTPLRRRIQEFIDRRFYRRKYNAERIVEAFGAHLRDDVNLDDLSRNLLAVVAEALQPETASLWLRPIQDSRRREDAETASNKSNQNP